MSSRKFFVAVFLNFCVVYICSLLCVFDIFSVVVLFVFFVFFRIFRIFRIFGVFFASFYGIVLCSIMLSSMFLFSRCQVPIMLYRVFVFFLFSDYVFSGCLNV